jgi:hypothetical protein
MQRGAAAKAKASVDRRATGVLRIFYRGFALGRNTRREKKDGK